MLPELEMHLQKLNKNLLLKEDKDFRCQLEYLVNHLIKNDFNRLVQVLYRIDVSETKLKKLLSENAGTDATIVITDLIIEREIQKIYSRKKNHSNKDIPDEEVW